MTPKIDNFRHNTPSVDYKYPNKENYDKDLKTSSWPFPCGGCGMEMSTPISPHLTPCNGCGYDYYICNSDEVERHRERPCTRKIKVVTEIFDPRWGSTYYQITYQKCTVKHRWCTREKAPHRIDIKPDGTKKLGTGTVHFPSPRVPPPHVGTM